MRLPVSTYAIPRVVRRRADEHGAHAGTGTARRTNPYLTTSGHDTWVRHRGV
jgi:hypothetical protein